MLWGFFAPHLSPQPPTLVVKFVGLHARREDTGCLLANAGIPRASCEKAHGEGATEEGETVDTGQPVLREMQSAWGTDELNHHRALQECLVVAVGNASVDISSRLSSLLASFPLQGTLKENKVLLNKKNNKITLKILIVCLKIPDSSFSGTLVFTCPPH